MPKITALVDGTGDTLDPTNDRVPATDVSDTSEAASGTTKQWTPKQVASAHDATSISAVLDLLGGAAGDVLVRGGSVWAALGIGTAGQSLRRPLDDTAGLEYYSPVRPLFDHYTDAGNGTTVETDLYSDTVAAGQFGANGDKLEAQYGGVFVSSATATRQIRLYFAGTSVFDSGALTLSLSSAWDVYVELIRVSSSVVRVVVSLTTQGAALAAYTSYTEVTGLTLSGTNVLKITGQAAGVGAATNDIVAKLGHVTFFPAA